MAQNRAQGERLEGIHGWNRYRFADVRLRLGGAILGDYIRSMVPPAHLSKESQRWIKAESLKLSEEVLKARWRTLGNQEGSVPKVFLIVVVFWLTVTFVSFGLYAKLNPAVLAVLFIAAISVAGAVFLILELDGPFDGVIKISSGPMRYALTQLGR